jgi:hypothetical protein
VDTRNSGAERDFPICVPWRHAIRFYLWEQSLDLSLKGAASFAVPCPWLQDALGLQAIPTEPGRFRGPDGTVLFQAPGLDANRSYPALVSRNEFLSALEKANLACLWIVAGERAWHDTPTWNAWARRSSSGVFHLADGGWRGASWCEDQGQEQ